MPVNALTNLTDDATVIDATTQPNFSPTGIEVALAIQSSVMGFAIGADNCEIYYLENYGFLYRIRMTQLLELPVRYTSVRPAGNVF